LSDRANEVVREVTIQNEQGLHLRPVTQFVDLASRFQSTVTVKNLTRDSETVDGKSAMHMVLLEAAKGCVLRIEARGDDAVQLVDALTELVNSGFPLAYAQPNDKGQRATE
jgi:phosphotransferase system HPr (HPr) family protein